MLKIAQVIKKMHCILQNIHTVNIERVESHAQNQLHSYVILFYTCTIDNELVIIMGVIVLTHTGCKDSAVGQWCTTHLLLFRFLDKGRSMTCLHLHTAEVNHTAPGGI